MAFKKPRSSVIILGAVVIQLALLSSCRCDDETPLLSEARDSAIDIDGFRVDPNLIEETIDDSLRSRSERQRESVSSSTRHPFDQICPYGYFACNNGECIAPKWRCDGHYDCDDFSDELNCTTLDLPQRGSIALPSSTTYTAPPARPNTTSAATSALGTQVYGLDFNSSVEPLMIFSTGSSIRGLWMRARIYFDIVIRNKSRSVAATQPTSITDAFSLFFGMFGADTQSFSGSSAPGQTGKSAPAADDGQQKPDNTIVGLDMDPNNKEVFWVELGKEPGVYSAVIEDDQFEARHRRQFHGHKKVVEFGLLSPEDIALDTVGKNAYITDAGLPAIVVCSYVHVYCKIIQQGAIHKPRAIIADSATGWITFTDWGDRPGIYLQSMDGARFEALIDTDVVWPNGLAADYAANQLYWADARLNKIERVDLATRERFIVIKETNTNPFSVTMFESRIYWSDWSKNEIKTCNKQTGNGTQVLMHADDIYGIHIYHPDLHKEELSNPCWSKHCSHMCLLSPARAAYSASRRAPRSAPGATCACPDSMVLSILDKATCYEVELSFMFINLRNYVAQVFPERIGQRAVDEIVYTSDHAIQDIASDWLHYRIFFFDAANQTICSADFSGREPFFEHFTAVSSKSIRGLLYDHMSENLYWLDPEAGTLTMFAIRGRFQRVLRRQLDQPTSMALDSRNRLFYIACLGARPHIMRLDVTGSEQSQVIIVDQKARDNFGLPVALHLDEQLQRLYWADAHLETIESFDLDVKSRTSGVKQNSHLVHKRRLGTILSFAVYHDYFLWTIQNDGHLYKGKIAAKKGARPLMFKLPANPSRDHPTADYKRLITVNPMLEASKSACHTTSCSHGCILDSSHAAKCVCPESFKLSIVNRTNCIEQSREEMAPMAPGQLAGGRGPPATVPGVATAGSASAALHNIIAHLDELGPAGEGNKKASPAASSPDRLIYEHSQPIFEHSQPDVQAAAIMAHYEGQPQTPPPLQRPQPQQQQQHQAPNEGEHEGNSVVWLIIFLLILSAAAVVTVVSLLVLHRQGRLPRQVSVSFISPSTTLGGSRASDKDRAMLLMDTDN